MNSCLLPILLWFEICRAWTRYVTLKGLKKQFTNELIVSVLQVFVFAVLISVVLARPQEEQKEPVAILSSESEGPNLDGSYRFK